MNPTNGSEDERLNAFLGRVVVVTLPKFTVMGLLEGTPGNMLPQFCSRISIVDDEMDLTIPTWPNVPPHTMIEPGTAWDTSVVVLHPPFAALLYHCAAFPLQFTPGDGATR